MRHTDMEHFAIGRWVNKVDRITKVTYFSCFILNRHTDMEHFAIIGDISVVSVLSALAGEVPGSLPPQNIQVAVGELVGEACQGVANQGEEDEEGLHCDESGNL